MKQLIKPMLTLAACCLVVALIWLNQPRAIVQQSPPVVQIERPAWNRFCPVFANPVPVFPVVQPDPLPDIQPAVTMEYHRHEPRAKQFLYYVNGHAVYGYTDGQYGNVYITR